MARWAPYSICSACGTGSWLPPGAGTHWGQHIEPSPEQHASWSGRHALRETTIGDGPGRLLDVGCGFGHFVWWALEHGWDAWGTDSDPWAIEASVAPGRTAQDPGELEGSFDVITLWDVLEHTTRPIDLAASLRPRLHASGRLFVCSPNFAAMKLRWPLVRQSARRFNELVRPTEHVVQFTERGMTLTLERAGYEKVDVLRPPLASRSNRLLDAIVRRWPSLRKGLFVNAYAPSV